MPLLTLQRSAQPGQPPSQGPPTPAGPYLTVSPGGRVTVESQNGVTANLRAVRPLWDNQNLAWIGYGNVPSNDSNLTMLSDTRGDLLRIWEGAIVFDRFVTTEDYGSFSTNLIVYPVGIDGPISLTLNVTISDKPAGPPPAPFPHNRNTDVLLMDFGPNTFSEAMSNTFGNLVYTGSSLLFDSYASAMTPPNPAGVNDDSGGYGNGLYEFCVRYHGPQTSGWDGPGDEDTGPATILWPYSNQWPGPEIDLGEFFANDPNSIYLTHHWKDPETGENRNDLWVVLDSPTIAPNRQFSTAEWHIYAGLLLNDRTGYYVDGKLLFENTEFPARDFANGGENHTIGGFVRADGIKMEYGWIRFTPEGALPNPVYPPGGVVPNPDVPHKLGLP